MSVCLKLMSVIKFEIIVLSSLLSVLAMLGKWHIGITLWHLSVRLSGSHTFYPPALSRATYGDHFIWSVCAFVHPSVLFGSHTLVLVTLSKLAQVTCSSITLVWGRLWSMIQQAKFVVLTNRFSNDLSDLDFSLSVIKLCRRKLLAWPREILAPSIGQQDLSAPDGTHL